MPEPRTLDYRTPYRMWGHNVSLTKVDGLKLEGFLWSGVGLQVGDYLLLTGKGTGDSRYRVTKVEQMRDPRDMFHFNATFSPRQGNPTWWERVTRRLRKG